jgi:tetratricopeptide (TPR) repeat protein
MNIDAVTAFLTKHLEGDIGIDQQLDRLIVLRQTLVSSGLLSDVLEFVKNSNEAFARDVRFQFLEAVSHYDAAVKRKENDPWEWKRIGDQFDALGEDSAVPPEVVCIYRHNYILLCRRNAGDGSAALRTLFEKLVHMARNLPLVERLEFLGHAYYNFARLLLKESETREALHLWQQASMYRIAYYLHQEEATREQQLAAAQQVAKMRCDFLSEGFFPQSDPKTCGVPRDFYLGLERTFGKDITKFSAAKS